MKKHVSTALVLALNGMILLSSCKPSREPPDSSGSSLGALSSLSSVSAQSSGSHVSSTQSFADGPSMGAISAVSISDQSQSKYQEIGIFQLRAPGEFGVSSTPKPTFEWTSAEHASGYKLTVSEDSTFQSVVYEKTLGNVTRHTAEKSLQNHKSYYWRVTAMNHHESTQAINGTRQFMTAFQLSTYLDSYLKKHPSSIEKKPTEPGSLYTPLNAYSWDYWFCKKDNVYHAFHLERPLTEREDYIAVGHATSTDLESWSYYGTVVKAESGKWDDLRIATGSIVHKDGLYYMYYTGHSTSDSGFGLTVSKDLFRFAKVGDGPVIPSRRVFTADWKGETREVTVGADPYVYPDPVNGYYYMVSNSFVKNSGENMGCLLMLKSKDLLNWETDRILQFPGTFLRMETPQIWNKNGKWYLYFGGVVAAKSLGAAPDPSVWNRNGDAEYCSNYIYTADKINGIYQPQPWSQLRLPDGTPFYILKALQDPKGQDVMLAHNWGGWKLLKPYRMVYGAGGKIQIQSR